MECFALVNPGLEAVAQQEIKELVKAKAIISRQALEFSVAGTKELVAISTQGQSFRRLMILMGKFAQVEDLNLNSLSFPWPDYFPPAFSFKIDVEGVKGQENRFELAGQLLKKLFPFFQEKGFMPTADVRKGMFTLVLYRTGSDTEIDSESKAENQYLLGLDCTGDVDSRAYRIFPHQATFKGDLAYYFVRKSGYQPASKSKMLIGFVRDGGLAIEAALFANKLPMREVAKMPFHNFPSLASEKSPEKKKKTVKMLSRIISFDPNRQSIIAAQKNGKIAGAAEAIEFHRYTLDELDTRFSTEEFDNIIVHLTKKDEEKINELFYQGNYVLKKGGCLLVIGRGGLELPTPENYRLKEQGEIQRGDSGYKWWLMEKR